MKAAYQLELEWLSVTSCSASLLQVVGVPVGSALQSTVKQAVAISGGQILVAKSGSSVAKAVGPKQVVTQGVAKAIVSGGGGTIVAQPVQTITKAQVTSTGAQKSTSQGSGRVILHLVNGSLWFCNDSFTSEIIVWWKNLKMNRKICSVVNVNLLSARGKDAQVQYSMLSPRSRVLVSVFQLHGQWVFGVPWDVEISRMCWGMGCRPDEL